MGTLLQVQAALQATGLSALTTATNAEPTDRWTFTLTGELLLPSGGCAWTGNLTSTAGLTVQVENAGDGGANMYTGDPAARLAFTHDAALVFPNDPEAADTLTSILDVLSDLPQGPGA
jgi:hypothetical protein